jgi:hypothetical protein
LIAKQEQGNNMSQDMIGKLNSLMQHPTKQANPFQFKRLIG